MEQKRNQERERTALEKLAIEGTKVRNVVDNVQLHFEDIESGPGSPREVIRAFGVWKEALNKLGLITPWRGKDSESLSYREWEQILFEVFFKELVRRGTASPEEKERYRKVLEEKWSPLNN